MEVHVELAKAAVDASSVGVVIAVLMDWMPHAAAVLTVLWLGARLWNEVMLAIYRARAEKRKKG